MDKRILQALEGLLGLVDRATFQYDAAGAETITMIRVGAASLIKELKAKEETTDDNENITS